MRLSKLVLHNFASYAERQELDLAVEHDRPIVLIGALNGAGKTSLLDGLKLVLYGKRAQCTTRGSQSYERFLLGCINRATTAGHGASLDLTFSYFEEGTEHVVRVRRFWQQAGAGVREELDVWHDGVLNRDMGERWPEKVEEFLPQSLSGLFLFDGEQIVEMATPGRSEEIIRTAIDGLLGADRVTQLVSDLEVVRDRQLKKAASSTLRKQLEQADASYADAHQRHESAVAIEAEASARVARLQQDVEEAENAISLAGGELYEQRDELRARRNHVDASLEQVDHELRLLAAGPLPFAMAKDRLEQAIVAAERELEAQRLRDVGAAVQRREDELLELVTELGADGTVLSRMREALERQRLDRQRQLDVPVVYGFTAEQVHELRVLVTTTIPAEQTKARSLLDRRRRLEAELEALERKLVAVPDSEAMRELMLRRADLVQQLERARAQRHVAEVARADAAVVLGHATSRLERLREQAVREAGDVSDAQRVAEYATKTQWTLLAFREKLIASHAVRLAELVFDSFRELYRKKSTLVGISIDPHSCALTLHGRGGVVPAERMSAGERQVLAVALLWGLARASGRPLPAVIDTPLGRLDNKHRATLVEHYFPRASHQVVILSTDSEVDPTWYARLAPYVARSFTLTLDEPSGATLIRPGYFSEIVEA